MKAFHSDEKIKDEYLKRVSAHQKADEIIKGKYWEGGKGCAVGCTIHSGDHRAYETELGIPRILARLEDGIFESLPNELAMSWPLQFLSAVNVGADLSLVWPKFAIWLLADEKYGVLRFAKTVKSKQAIQSVADLYVLQVQGAVVSIENWQDARAAAAYAARTEWRTAQSEKLLELLRDAK